MTREKSLTSYREHKGRVTLNRQVEIRYPCALKSTYNSDALQRLEIDCSILSTFETYNFFILFIEIAMKAGIQGK